MALRHLRAVPLLLAAWPVSGQETEPTQGQPSAEIGGRIVISGETIEVRADPDLPPSASSIATKTDTPLLETPRSVTIVDSRVLEEMDAITITQAHDFVVGFTPQDERGPAVSRGFLVGFYDLRRDGLRTYSWSVREPAAVERIQYLRGPAAILYGDGSPGGLVNMVLKKPLPFERYEASASAGGDGYARATFDATGSLTASRGVRYRVVGAYEQTDDGYANDESRLSVLPMLSFDLGGDTTLHLDGEYYDQRGRGYRHTVPVTVQTQRGDFSAIPWDLNMASPDDDWRGWNVSGGLRLDSRLGARSSLHVAGRYTKIVGDLDVQALAALAADGHTAQRFYYREKSEWHEYQADTFLTTDFATGSVSHRVVAGLEAGLSTTDSLIGTAGAPSLDIDAPVYGPKPAEPRLAPTDFDTPRFGVYVQDQARVLSSLTLVPALRWSRLEVDDHVADVTLTEDAVSPSLGLVFLPRPSLSLYATYTEGFEPPAPGQFAEGGRPLEPIESESIEAGVKASLLVSRLSFSGAVYRIRQTNVAELDPAGFYRQIAEGETTGVELEAVGSPVRGLEVLAGYAWCDAEITGDLAGFEGNALPNAPRHKANVWTRYRFAEDRLRRLTLGAGVVHVGERYATRDNAVRVPAYTRVDLTASVELAGPRLTLGLVAQNVGDVRYVTSGTRTAFFAGPPRRLAVSLGSTF
jgi:iron complex outermembrane receptor protein